MKTLTEQIKKSTLINAGNFQISIGTHSITDIAIISKKTGEFCKFSDIKRGGKLAKAKRKFKLWLCSTETLNFANMQPQTTIELINFLKN
jgi:hypothetical protein